MEVNYGALIGGISVAASLLVFLVCFLISGVGPKCCRLLAGRCLSRRRGAKFNTAPQLRSRDFGPGAVPTTSPCLIQVPAVGTAVVSAKATKRMTFRGCKSAPNPPRPASPDGRRLTSPQPQPPPPALLPQLRVVADPWHLQGGYGLSLGRRKANIASRKTPGRAAAQQQLTRSSPQLLPLPGGGRRGLSGMQLSLSTIRDCSGSLQIPPDCLYAAAHESESQYAGFRSRGTEDHQVPLPAAADAHETAAISLRAQIGSVYGPLSRMPPPPHQQQPLSNASSSDCHDWSPPRPMPPADVGSGDGGMDRRYAVVASDAVIWASEDGDVAVFDVEAAAAAPRTRGGYCGPGTSGNDRSTSF